MYNYNAIVDYKKYDEDDIYRQQICQSFNIDNYNHDIIMETITNIYEKYKNNNDFMQIINHSSKLYNEEEDLYSLMYLFSWDKFEVLHKCLNDLNNCEKINENNLNLLTK